MFYWKDKDDKESFVHILTEHEISSKVLSER